jgi:hypothetical protein
MRWLQPLVAHVAHPLISTTIDWTHNGSSLAARSLVNEAQQNVSLSRVTCRKRQAYYRWRGKPRERG